MHSVYNVPLYHVVDFALREGDFVLIDTTPKKRSLTAILLE